MVIKMKGKKKNKSNVQECNSCSEEVKVNEPSEKEEITTEDSEQEDEKVEEKENKED